LATATDLRSAGCLEGFPRGSLAGSPAVEGQTGDHLAAGRPAGGCLAGDHLAADRSLLALLVAGHPAMALVPPAGEGLAEG
jgi:hypothetical protein